jgi:hypothetical protein
MSELKEGVNVNVNIDETPEVQEDEIKDIDLVLNTLTSNSATYTTERINGKLLALIISSSRPCHINIAFAEVPGIDVYDKVDFIGSYYLPVKITAVSKSSNQFNFVASSFYLNNALKISVEGQIDTEVKVTIRYCED